MPNNDRKNRRLTAYTVSTNDGPLDVRKAPTVTLFDLLRRWLPALEETKEAAGEFDIITITYNADVRAEHGRLCNEADELDRDISKVQEELKRRKEPIAPDALLSLAYRPDGVSEHVPDGVRDVFTGTLMISGCAADEPWEEWEFASGFDGPREAEALRVKAAWNACAGVPTAALAAATPGAIADVVLAADFALSVLKSQGMYDQSERMAVDKLTAALAKVRGEEAPDTPTETEYEPRFYPWQKDQIGSSQEEPPGWLHPDDCRCAYCSSIPADAEPEAEVLHG